MSSHNFYKRHDNLRSKRRTAVANGLIQIEGNERYYKLSCSVSTNSSTYKFNNTSDLEQQHKQQQHTNSNNNNTQTTTTTTPTTPTTAITQTMTKSFNFFLKILKIFL